MNVSNAVAQNDQPGSSGTQGEGTGFKKVYFDVAEDTPIDLSKTEIAKNLAGMVVQAAGMIGGVQLAGGFHTFNKKNDPAAPDLMSTISDKAAKKQLEIHLGQYEKAGYLERREQSANGKNTTWTTTPKFRGLDVLTFLYKDIVQYAKEKGITNEDLESIGCSAKMEIRREIDRADCRDPITHLYRCCKGTGVDNITTSDIAGQFDDLPFGKMGKILMENALSVPTKQTSQSAQRQIGPLMDVSPLVGRVLMLAAMCGIRALQFSDIPIILAKAALFEHVVRCRISLLRNHHPSQIINTLLFGGKTESHGAVFLEQDGAAYTNVGKIEKEDTATFDDPWKTCKCTLKLERRIKYTVGRRIYMPVAWARLLSQRRAVKTGINQDPSSLDDINFIVVETNGTLFAQPSGKGTFMSDLAATSRHYGGMVGPTSCDCASNAAKSDLSKSWKYNDKLTIPKAKKPWKYLRHASTISTGEMVVLDYRGDWPIGVFYMQALPQSSYVQGKKQCLNCAIRSAASVGCPQVIACSDETST